MQYYYPLTTDSLESIKNIFDSSNSQGIIQSLSPSMAILLFIISCILILFISLFLTPEFVGNMIISVIISFVSIVVLFIFSLLLYMEHIHGGGQETRMKNELISATSDSWQNKEEYIKFQSNIGRYLESQNIDIEKNCANILEENNVDNTLEVDDSQEITGESLNDELLITIDVSGINKKEDPSNTIICDNESKQVSGLSLIHI